MLFEGCQGKKGNTIQEKDCPNCGTPVEWMTSDVCGVCGNCGFVLYSDGMECVWRCPRAKQCVGEENYKRMTEAKEKLAELIRAGEDDDQW